MPRLVSESFDQATMIKSLLISILLLSFQTTVVVGFPFVGEIRMFAGNFAPRGWACEKMDRHSPTMGALITRGMNSPTLGPNFHVVGGGPVGLAVALLIAKQGLSSIVYEGRPEIKHVPEESYPIGVNARGMHTLSAIDENLAQAVRDASTTVASWQIFGGPMKVAEQESGVVQGTSRGAVNDVLLQAASANPLITLKFGLRIRDVRANTRELIFEKRVPGDVKREEVIVSCGQDGRVIACDGVNSAVRRSLVASGELSANVQPWKAEFRVLFARNGATSPELDEKVHYIFSG